VQVGSLYWIAARIRSGRRTRAPMHNVAGARRKISPIWHGRPTVHYCACYRWTIVPCSTMSQTVCMHMRGVYVVCIWTDCRIETLRCFRQFANGVCFDPLS
jgi:hypothetical protein